MSADDTRPTSVDAARIVDGVEVADPPLLGDDRVPLHERHPVAPELVDALRELGGPYGPMGVAVVAARLTDPTVLVRLLTDHRRDRAVALPSDGDGEPSPTNPQSLREALRYAVNVHCAENGSNTPDRVLAQYLLDCLVAFDNATRGREHWYGRADRPGGAR